MLQDDKHSWAPLLCGCPKVPRAGPGSSSTRWSIPIQDRAGGGLCCSVPSPSMQSFTKITGQNQNEQKINSPSTCPKHESCSLNPAVLRDALPETSLSVHKSRGQTPAQTDALSPCPAQVRASVPVTPDLSLDVPLDKAVCRGLGQSALLSRRGHGAHGLWRVGRTAGSAVCSWPLLIYTAPADVWLIHPPLNKPFLPHMVHKVPDSCRFCCCCTCILVAGSKYSQ